MRALTGLLLAAGLSYPGAALSFSDEGGSAKVGTSSATNSLEAAGDHSALLEQLEMKIGGLEQRIVAAQEKVDVLKDTVLAGVVTKAKARIVHKNEMGGSFELVHATYVMDGGVIFDKEDNEGSLSEQEEIVLFDGPISPGEHDIEVSLVFRVGSLGVFTYVEGYKFKVQSRYTLKAVDGRLNKLSIVSFDKGESDVTKETSDRLGVRYDFEAVIASQTKPPAPTPDPTQEPTKE